MAQEAYRIKTIVLDAGHGGHDSGCRGVSAVEKEVTLDIALLTEKLLKEALPDVQIVQTRRTDVFVPLHQRAQIANKHRADLFVSIHCNASKSSAPYGTETYLMGLHVSEENLEVSMRENSVIAMEKNYETHYEGFDPQSPEAYIVLSMNQSAHLAQSITLASLIEKELARRGRHSRGVKQAGFLVLWRVTMPAVLVEVGFLSNRNEERFLASEEGKRQIARGIADAIVTFKRQVEAADQKEELLSASGKPKPGAEEADREGYELPEERIKPDQNMVFRIQLYASTKLLPAHDARFASVGDSLLVEHTEQGLYRYLVGAYSDYEMAQSHLDRYRKQGYKDAYVVSYREGKRVQ